MQKKTCVHKVTAGTVNHRTECLILQSVTKKLLKFAVVDTSFSLELTTS